MAESLEADAVTGADAGTVVERFPLATRGSRAGLEPVASKNIPTLRITAKKRAMAHHLSARKNVGTAWAASLLLTV